ncbi:MAG: universal stress protein [Gemmatimonadaceae bacterium]|nr:universal stress protein [Gemmatimonadaceae bacterium]
MTALTQSAPSSSWQSWEYESSVPGGVVVGVDGSPESIAALNSASPIGKARHCPVHVVSVIPPFPSYHLDPGVDASRENVEQLRVQLRDSAIADLLKAADVGTEWSREVVLGRPARMITMAAEKRGASLIVIGRRRHGLMDRILGGETTLQVMRLSSVPVLAVAGEMDTVRTVVVATDFSPSSVRAARVALDMMGRSGMLYLVFVEPPVPLYPEGFAMPDEVRYPGDVVVWFRRMIEVLKAPPEIIVEPVVLNGKPVQAVVEFAERVGADMIAAGTHGHNRMERFLLGSVSTGLVRNADCAVLVAPAAE